MLGRQIASFRGMWPPGQMEGLRLAAYRDVVDGVSVSTVCYGEDKKGLKLASLS